MKAPSNIPGCIRGCRPFRPGAAVCGACGAWMAYQTDSGPVYFDLLRETPLIIAGKTCQMDRIVRVFARPNEYGCPVVTGLLASIVGDDTRLLRQMPRPSPDHIGDRDRRDWAVRWLQSTEDALRRVQDIPLASYPKGLIRVDGSVTIATDSLALVTARVERLRECRVARGVMGPAILRQLTADLGEAVIAAARAGVTLQDIKLENIVHCHGHFQILDIDTLTHGVKTGEFTPSTAAPEMLTAPFLPAGFKEWEHERLLQPESDLYPWAVTLLQAAGLRQHPSAAQRLAIGEWEVPEGMDPARLSPPLPQELVSLLRRSLHLRSEERPALDEVAGMLAILRLPVVSEQPAAISLPVMLQAAWRTLSR